HTIDYGVDPTVWQRVLTGEEIRFVREDELGNIVERALFAPLVEAQRQSCRLGAAAQWRLISDALAYAWLQVGKQQKAEDFARRDFFEGLLGEASKLNNRQVRWTSLHWQDRIETFVSRGGCCRYYTADDGDYCRTCVHRDTEQQRTLMTQWYEAASLSD
ncbi:MAG: (2Fe-2S)-binding protein, partial [Reinekea sp.]|nr:(2Fe-2S)-binding protein [Reinekea sp.]